MDDDIRLLDDTAERPPSRPSEPEGRARVISPWSLLLGGAILVALLMGQWVWVIAILGLALLITVHEFGHFIAAKAFGMRVEKFYVGFPPAALRHTWGETEYGIGIIPLGGFCKISGMTPEEEVPEDIGDRAYYKKAVWKRNITIFAGPLMNFIAAAVILVLFVGIGGVPKASLTLEEVVKDAPAGKIGLVAGDTLVGADGQTWTTWDEASAYFRAHPNETIELTYRPKGETATQTVDRHARREPAGAGKRLPRRRRLGRAKSTPGCWGRCRSAPRASATWRWAPSPASGGSSPARSTRRGRRAPWGRSASST